MDNHGHRPFLVVVLVPSLRLEKPPLHVFVQSTFEPEFLAFIEILSLQGVGRQVSNLVCLALETLAFLEVRPKVVQVADEIYVVG